MAASSSVKLVPLDRGWDILLSVVIELEPEEQNDTDTQNPLRHVEVQRSELEPA